MATTVSTTRSVSRGVWADDEHERFREALELYPNGPWKAIAAFVGTRTVRQVQTHAQKYHEKAARRLRDLRLNRERLFMPNVLIDFEMQGICEDLHRYRVPVSPRSSSAQLWELESHWSDSDVSADIACYQFDEAAPEWSALPSYDESIDFLIQALDSCSSQTTDAEALDTDSDASLSECNDCEST